MEFIKLLCITLFFVLICSPPSAAAPAAECPDPGGDSNSDTAGFAAAYGVVFGYRFGRRFFHRSSHCFSDGRIIIDFLCDNVKTDYLSSYLESLTPNFEHGVNFAVGDAMAFSKTNFFTLKIQIEEFRCFHSRSLILHSEGIKGMLDGDDFGNALYMIDIGQNDITNAFSNTSKVEAIQQCILLQVFAAS